MVGRATFGRPWIFREIQQALHPEDYTEMEEMTSDWKLDILKEQVKQSVERIDERRGILHVRRHLAATPLFKGLPNFRQTRIAMLRAETMDELFEIMESIRPLVREVNGASQ